MDGAVGMELIDWFDLVMHSFPFALLIYTIIDFFRFQKREKEKAATQTGKSE